MRRTALLLFLSGFLIRAVFVLLVRDVHAMPVGLSSADDIEFNTLAQHLARGEGYTNRDSRLTSFRAPGWPFFLAGLYTLFGERPEAVYLTNCILGGLACTLAYLLGRQLLDELGARLAGWLCVFFVPHWWFATMFYSENLFVPLLAVAAWMMLLLYTNKIYDILFVFALGAILGLAVLTRPFAVLLLPLWGLLLVDRRVWRRSVLYLAALGVGTLLVLAPWIYRNYQVHDRFVFVATNGGSTFYGGNNPRVVREWRYWGSWLSTVELPGRDEIVAAGSELASDQVEWQLGLKWIRAHPDEAAVTVPLKVARLIFWLPDFDAGRWYLVLRVVCWVPVLLLGLVGGWLCLRGPVAPGWLVIHLVMMATVLTAVIFWGSPRFRDANAPLLMLYPALALSTWRRS